MRISRVYVLISAFIVSLGSAFANPTNQCISDSNKSNPIQKFIDEINIITDEIELAGVKVCHNSQKIAEVKRDLKTIRRWLDRNCSDDLDAILSTIKTHAMLYVNSECFSNSKEASLSSIKARVEKLWPVIDTLKVPYIDKVDPTTAETRLNILNRQLFLELDQSIDGVINPAGAKISCATPIVEWAQNVIPEFTLEKLGVSKDDPEFKDKALVFLDRNFKRDDLKRYLSQGWKNMFRNIKLHGDNPKKNREFCESLSVSMCYPARKSMPVSSSLIKREPKSQKLAWSEIVDGSTLNEKYEEFGTAHCRELKKELDKSDFDYFGCKSIKQTFCATFWTSLAKHYTASLGKKLDESNLDRMKADNFKALIQEFKNIKVALSDELICE